MIRPVSQPHTAQLDTTDLGPTLLDRRSRVVYGRHDWRPDDWSTTDRRTLSDYSQLQLIWSCIPSAIFAKPRSATNRCFVELQRSTPCSPIGLFLTTRSREPQNTARLFTTVHDCQSASIVLNQHVESAWLVSTRLKTGESWSIAVANTSTLQDYPPLSTTRRSNCFGLCSVVQWASAYYFVDIRIHWSQIWWAINKNDTNNLL